VRVLALSKDPRPTFQPTSTRFRFQATNHVVVAHQAAEVLRCSIARVPRTQKQAQLRQRRSCAVQHVREAQRSQRETVQVHKTALRFQDSKKGTMSTGFRQKCCSQIDSAREKIFDAKIFTRCHEDAYAEQHKRNHVWRLNACDSLHIESTQRWLPLTEKKVSHKRNRDDEA